MTERIKEQLSAFLDGELPEPESALLLKRLERDDDLRGALSRYSLIGAVLRADGDVPAARQVAARVSAAIAREPTVREQQERALRWRRPLTGLGIAASVAAAALLLTQPLRLSGPTAEPAAAVRMAATDLPQESAVVPEEDLPPAYTTPPAGDGPGQMPPLRFANYLVAHSGYASPLAHRSLISGLIVTPQPADAATPAAAP